MLIEQKKMNSLMILNLMTIRFSISVEGARKSNHGLSSKNLFQTDNFMDLLNISFHDNGQNKFRSPGSQYYDPVLWSRSVLVDFLEGMNVKVNDDEDLEKLPARRKRSTRQKYTESCDSSLCPWTMHWNEDAARVPQFIRYAKCQTDYCNFSFAKLGLFTLFKLRFGTQCETITTDIFSTKDGKENWITGWPIACICAKVGIHTPSHKPFPVFFSGAKRRKPQMTSNLEVSEDTPSRNYYSGYRGNDMEENPNIYIGVDDRSLTDAQRERLLRQETLKRQHSESFEKVMEKERSKT